MNYQTQSLWDWTWAKIPGKSHQYPLKLPPPIKIPCSSTVTWNQSWRTLTFQSHGIIYTSHPYMNVPWRSHKKPIWGFPEMGVPQIIHFRLGFSLLGIPMTMDTPIWVPVKVPWESQVPPWRPQRMTRRCHQVLGASLAFHGTPNGWFIRENPSINGWVRGTPSLGNLSLSLYIIYIYNIYIYYYINIV